jgi:uncharacterized membrane protein
METNLSQESIAFSAKKPGRVPRAFLAMPALWIGSLVQIWWFYPKLPAIVASHYNAAGIANGWMAKASFARFDVLVVTLMAGLFFVFPWMLGKIPASLWNLPNKDFWLADARRAETVRFMQGRLAVFGVAVQCVLLAIFQLGLEAAADKTNSIGTAAPVTILVGLVVFSALWSLGILRRFGKRGTSR